MKKTLFILFSLILSAITFAQPVISNTNFTQSTTNNFRYLVTFDTNVAANAYVKVVNTATLNETFSYVAAANTSHNVYYQGFLPNQNYEMYAVAFNATGLAEELLGTVVGSSIIGFDVTTPATTTANFTNRELTFSTPNPEGETSYLVWMDVNGNITRLQNDNTVTAGYNCKNHLINDSIIVTVDCDSLSVYDYDYNLIQTKVNVDDTVLYHGKPYINTDNNLAVLNAHTHIVDKSFVGGNSNQLMIGDGVMVYDYQNDNVVQTWAPISGFNPFNTVFVPGEYDALFPDAEHWRLSNSIAQDFNGSYLMNQYLEQQVSRVNLASGFPDWSMPSYNILVGSMDELSDVRDFTSLGTYGDSGYYFGMANRYDSLITRCIEGFIMYDYQISMFMGIRDYRLPANEWSPSLGGGGLKIPSEDFHKVIMISDINRISQVDETDVVEWTVDLSQKAIPLSFVNAYGDVLTADDILNPVVTATAVDTLICANYNTPIDLMGSPAGGYFTGEGVYESLFYTDSVATGTYEVTYHFGFDSTSFMVYVEECLNSNDLFQMGGIYSSIYPNPVKSNAMLRFELVETEEVKIEIYNNIGELIKTYNLGYFNDGLNKVSLNLNDISNGNYIYRLKAGKMFANGNFIVAK